MVWGILAMVWVFLPLCVMRSDTVLQDRGGEESSSSPVLPRQCTNGLLADCCWSTALEGGEEGIGDGPGLPPTIW